MSDEQITAKLEPRTQTIADLVDQCARGDLPFSGPGSLCEKVSAMGYRCTSLYEMVMCRESDLMAEHRRKKAGHDA